MKFAIGFSIIIFFGIAVIVGIVGLLTGYGFSELELTIAKLILIVVLLAIPPILLFFGGNSSQGDNRIEQIGKPVKNAITTIAHFSSTNLIIIVLLLVILNVLIWK